MMNEVMLFFALSFLLDVLPILFARLPAKLSKLPRSLVRLIGNTSCSRTEFTDKPDDDFDRTTWMRRFTVGKISERWAKPVSPTYRTGSDLEN